jgi:hypothetical protein
LITDCEIQEIIQGDEPYSISPHDFVLFYDDGRTQILKCKKCGVESEGFYTSDTIVVEKEGTDD